MTVAIGQLNMYTAGVLILSASLIYAINASLLGQTRANKRIEIYGFYSHGTNS